MGYVDVPMAMPDAVAAASNGLWLGPSATEDRKAKANLGAGGAPLRITTTNGGVKVSKI